MTNIKSNYSNFLILLPIYWTFTGMFLYPNGKKLLVVLVVLAVITSLYCYGLQIIKDNLRKNPLLWLLASISFFALIANYTYGYSSSNLHAYITLCVYFLILPQSLIVQICLKLLTILGAISALIFTSLQVFLFDNGRMWDINPLIYSPFIASISILALYFLFQSNIIKHMTVWLITFLLSVIPLFYSQARGLWLALLLAAIVLIVKSLLSDKRNIIFIIPISLIMISAFYLSADKITQRIAQTTSEIQQIKQGNLDTSIGLRLQMWQVALPLAEKSPLFGLGDSHKKEKQALATQGKISPVIVQFSHYHNQFISNLVKYGVVGLCLLLLSFLLPTYYFFKNRSPYKWPGFLVLLIFFIAAQTDVPLQHAQNITFYFMIIYITLCAPIIRPSSRNTQQPRAFRKSPRKISKKLHKNTHPYFIFRCLE